MAEKEIQWCLWHWTLPGLGVAVGLEHPSGRPLLQPPLCSFTAHLFSVELSITPLSGSHTLSLRLNAARVLFLLRAEKGSREIMSFSSLEGNLGTVVSCGCNYEHFSDYSVLWKGITGRYIVLELLTALLSYLFWVFFFNSVWSADLEFSSRNKYLEIVLSFLHILYGDVTVFSNYFILF